MNLDEESGLLLEVRKCLVSLGSLLEQLLCGSESCDGSSDNTEFLYEMSVKVGQPQKALQLLSGLQGRSVFSSLSLGRLSFDLSTLKNENKEGYGWDVELTCFCFNIQMILQQPRKNQADLEFLWFRAFGEDEDFI